MACKVVAVSDMMTAAGVEDLERAQGEWQDGQWVDFDPLAPPHKIGVESRSVEQRYAESHRSPDQGTCRDIARIVKSERDPR